MLLLLLLVIITIMLLLRQLRMIILQILLPTIILLQLILQLLQLLILPPPLLLLLLIIIMKMKIMRKMKSARILSRVRKTCCYSNFREKPSTNGDVKYSQVVTKDIHTDHLISARRPDLIMINKKERTCKTVDFSVPADLRIKLKECEKKDKYLDFARELKKLCNMKVSVVPIVIGAFGIVTKGLLKGLEELEVGRHMKTIKTTALLKTARILRSSWRLDETCYHSNSRENHQLTLMWKL